ncbi:MAG: hypothetical protein AB7P04_15870 [Bacteriovoracia bacterium]
MFKLALVSLLVSSVGFAADDVENLLKLSPSGQKIVACGGEFSGGSELTQDRWEIRAVVLRNNGKWDIPFAEFGVGKVLSIVGYKRPNSQGVQGSILADEGTTVLLDRVGEKWTAPAPYGTYFTARGNYTGFFLAEEDERGGVQMVSGRLAKFGEDTRVLECTTDIEKLKVWLKRAVEFNPWR